MGLVLDGITNKDMTLLVERTFESMGEGLLLLNVNIYPKSSKPYHWFLESDIKPPLDIAIDSESGRLVNICLFFQNEKIVNKDIKFSCVKKTSGVPKFDISDFSRIKFQIYEKGGFFSYKSENDLYFFINDFYVRDAQIDFCLNMPSKITLFFGKDESFMGFVLNDLSSFELKQMKLSKVL